MAETGTTDAERFNGISLINIAFSGLGLSQIGDTEWDNVASSMKIQLLIPPQHGVLIPSEKYPNSYKYQASDGYVGFDQMIFEVKVDGKTFKGIYSVYVGGDVDNGSCSVEKGYYRVPEGEDPDAIIGVTIIGVRVTFPFEFDFLA